MARVLLIDNSDVGRMGRTAALESMGHAVTPVRWVDVASHMGPTIYVGSHDVVLVGLRPDFSTWDCYGCLVDVRRVAETIGSNAKVLALLWGAAADNPLLLLRMERAGIVRHQCASEVCSAEDLHRFVVDSAQGRRTRPTTRDLALAGVRADADPEAVVAWVSERVRDDAPFALAYRQAFDPRYTQNACGLSRRQAHTLRVKIAALAKVVPSISSSGGGPVRDCSLPRWNEVTAVANLCRGWQMRYDSGADLMSCDDYCLR